MLVKLTGISGYPVAVESDDVRAIEPLFEQVKDDGTPDGDPIGSAVHMNCQGVTSVFQVRESVEEVLELVGQYGMTDAFGRKQIPEAGAPFAQMGSKA